MKETCKRCHHDRSEHTNAGGACSHTRPTNLYDLVDDEVTRIPCRCTRFVHGPVDDHRLAPRPWRP
jgi:hypothetical protein